MAPAFSIVVETLTRAEGGDRSRFRHVLGTAARLAAAEPGGEVLVPLVLDAPGLQAEIASAAPQARILDARGLGYDEAKMLAARQARGPYVAFLDGDCVPEPGWLEALLGPLQRGEAVATGGYPRYERGVLSALQSVQDFGVHEPPAARPLQCYASNNCAFLREALLREPVPTGPLRCRCFLHAQRLIRRGTPVVLVPEAQVLHEPQPFVRERSRQGYDRVAACWADPDLWEARLLRFGLLALPLFYALAVALDVRRLAHASRLASWRRMVGVPLAAVLRLADAGGMLRALRRGPAAAGWDGYWDSRAASASAPTIGAEQRPPRQTNAAGEGRTG